MANDGHIGHRSVLHEDQNRGQQFFARWCQLVGAVRKVQQEVTGSRRQGGQCIAEELLDLRLREPEDNARR